MAGYKETPRQKMIAMMYLVLTALLALNVSKEVLDAFVVVNESVVRTNLTFSQKINDSYTKFERSFQLLRPLVGMVLRTGSPHKRAQTRRKAYQQPVKQA